MVMGIQEESLLSSSLQFFALNFFGGAWVLKSLQAEVQKQRAPGSDGLVDLWDGLVIKITSPYNKDNWSPLWKSLLTNQYSEIGFKLLCFFPERMI